MQSIVYLFRTEWNYQSNIDPEELFRQIFGDVRNFRNARGGRQDFGFGTIFEDFAQNFGFGQAQESATNKAIPDKNAAVPITIGYFLPNINPASMDAHAT